MKNLLMLVIAVAMLTRQSCSLEPSVSTTVNAKKTLVVTLKDYSISYQDNVVYDSTVIRSLFYRVAQTGGTIVLVRVDDNSTKQSVYLSQVVKLDTQSTGTITNIYERSRVQKKNEQLLRSSRSALDSQIADYIREVNRYGEAKFTDLQQGLLLSATTACEAIYQQGYNRYVLCLSDMINDPPYARCQPLKPVNMCGASMLLVRPATSITKDSLQRLFPSSDVHQFTTVSSAISFINQ